MFDVITVGSNTVDVFVHTESDLITIKTPYSEEELIAYPSGSKILIKKLSFRIGGGGTNTAVSFSRLGLKTAYLGKVGDDDNGKKVLSLLKKEKINFVGLVDSKEQTGYSIILDSIGQDRTILTNKGANNNLRFGEINKKKLKARWFYFSSMMADSLITLDHLAHFAHENEMNIAFNPSSYLIKENKNLVLHILAKAKILLFNKEEAELLCGPHEIHEIKKMLKKIHQMGPDIVVITDGANGCYASDKLHFYSIRPRKTKVIETTGAGDAFASSFLTGFIKKREMDFALRMGMANSEAVIQHIGAKENLLTYKKVLLSIKKRPHKIKKERFK